MSDFDKMRIQLIIDLQDLSKQVLTLYPNADITTVIEIQQDVKAADFMRLQEALDSLSNHK